MATALEEILARTAEDLKVRKTAAASSLLERKASARSRPRGFIAGLRSAAATRPAVIAELKKASPSKGLIRPEFDPAKLASSLEAAGAAALSVLTDEPFFQGSLANLEIASSVVSIPCLRKDFILDPFQVLEARASGADAILLILAALSDRLVAELREAARILELDVLCEVHSHEEMERAAAHGFPLIGVNSRDLHSFTKSPDLLYELAFARPVNTLLVAESGIRSGAEIERLRAAGYTAFLIGEALMREPDPARALAAMLSSEPSTKK